MSQNIISCWHAECVPESADVVLPDGCRDLIVKTVPGMNPQWFVSELYDRAMVCRVDTRTGFTGFRLKPGVMIQEEALLHHINTLQYPTDAVHTFLDDFITCDPCVDEALACLAQGQDSVSQASSTLGVSTRTLQRLIGRKTGRTPGFWFRLARVRTAAQLLAGASGLADIADSCGFSDQSHMNREFRLWFRTTPAGMLRNPAVLDQLQAPAYAATGVQSSIRKPLMS